MRMNERHLKLRRILGVGLGVAATTAVAVFAMSGGLALANGDPVSTVTTVVVDNSASAHQEGVLSDGSVSDAEMQETIDAVVQCIGQAGYQVDRVDFYPGLTWGVDIVTESKIENERARAVVDECTNAEAPITDAYWSQNILTPDEQKKLEGMTRECLATQGVELNESQGRPLAATVPALDWELFAQCHAEARAQVR